MVSGIEIFKEHFQDYSDKYVFIGGTACDLILSKEGFDFRATKDLDVVLITEVIDEKFVAKFIEFIELGGYRHLNKGKNKNQFYRFELPENRKFPYMIELFSRKPDFLADFDVKLAPIHVSDEVISLSAILLDDEYYSLLTTGVTEIDGISVLDIEYLILFKIKAWLDLTERKREGEKIDGKNIRKHKNDIFRLAAIMRRNAHIPIPDVIRKDAEMFITVVADEPVDLQSLKIRKVTYKDLLENLCECYGITESPTTLDKSGGVLTRIERELH